MSSRPTLSLVAAIVLAAHGCAPESEHPVSPKLDDNPLHSEVLLEMEAELLGNVFDDTSKVAATDYYFELVPWDAATVDYLEGTSFYGLQWIDPGREFGIAFYDPHGDSGYCTTSYVDYLSGDDSLLGPEQHAIGPSQPATGKERHCIIPGRYLVRLIKDEVEMRSFLVDYLPFGRAGGSQPLALTEDDDTLRIEAPEFDPATTTEHSDLVVNFHVNPTEQFTDMAVLEIENAGWDKYRNVFSDQRSLAGTTNDWFRYRTNLSTSGWDLHHRGTQLVRLWWKDNNPFNSSGYFYNHPPSPVLRLHQYEGEVTPPEWIEAGLEVKRPDEDPAAAPAVTRSIFIDAAPTGPVACFDFEPNGQSTWRMTDQFLDANCSTGGSLEYAWDFGSGFGTFTSEPVAEFFGHSTAGTNTVRLRVRDASADEDTASLAATVTDDRVTLTGPSYVTDKRLKTYTASVLSAWYERYDPDTLTTWYLTSSPATVYTRIWPAGDYTRALRAEKTTASPLGRGRIDVVVCHSSLPGCEQEMVAMAGNGHPAVLPSSAQDAWGMLGAGPWLASKEALVRFYDLTGLHEPGSPFADTGWLEARGGETTDHTGRWRVRWRQVLATDPGVRIVDLEVEPQATGEYRFGFAVDPDLGASPADDRAGFDADRGLAYAYDGTAALGLLLHGQGRDALHAVEQYGTRNWAPRTELEARAVLETDRVRLLEGTDDVQFVLSGGTAEGTSRWRLVLIRAGSVRELMARADGYLNGEIP